MRKKNFKKSWNDPKYNQNYDFSFLKQLFFYFKDSSNLYSTFFQAQYRNIPFFIPGIKSQKKVYLSCYPGYSWVFKKKEKKSVCTKSYAQIIDLGYFLTHFLFVCDKAKNIRDSNSNKLFFVDWSRVLKTGYSGKSNVK